MIPHSYRLHITLFIENDTDLFKELKKSRKTKIESSETIDGKSGDEIPNKFADVYEELFNRIDDSNELNSILDSLANVS